MNLRNIIRLAITHRYVDKEDLLQEKELLKIIAEKNKKKEEQSRVAVYYGLLDYICKCMRHFAVQYCSKCGRIIPRNRIYFSKVVCPYCKCDNIKIWDKEARCEL